MVFWGEEVKVFKELRRIMRMLLKLNYKVKYDLFAENK